MLVLFLLRNIGHVIHRSKDSILVYLVEEGVSLIYRDWREAAQEEGQEAKLHTLT